jgi:hypothetical protein
MTVHTKTALWNSLGNVCQVTVKILLLSLVKTGFSSIQRSYGKVISMNSLRGKDKKSQVLALCTKAIDVKTMKTNQVY